ncbi:hypothetical protein P9E05_11450 [Bacillus mojavensis]|uniref:hypothetical protein n=1 Tax=Bacillus mojavensis TaxID=72360 RepID=UPI002DBF0446|nr:hypothetical protein [Bacillus mojavensis]MEC1614150.1 hypothetical protein [Bacillus mojavensis]MEC1692106.1 hypothetical protein [Bacillus mojavensis]
MFKKIIKTIKYLSRSSSDRHRRHRHYSSSRRRHYRSYSSSSGRRRHYDRYGGSHRYKRRSYSSS